MSRNKHYSLDDAEVLETKVDQLEKRLENLERFVFSQPKQNESSSSAQLVQVIASLLDRQAADDSRAKRDAENQNQVPNNATPNPQDDPISSKVSSPLHIDRLRTVV